jgi:Uma2 family endonuclease
MGMPEAQTRWTVAMLDALPEGIDRHEIIDGELFVTPAPGEAHQLVVGRLFVLLDAYLQRARVGRALTSPADVWRDERMHNRVQPDVFVVRLVDGKRPAYPYHIRDLLLAIEVASPGNPLLDYQIKRDRYLREGLAEYWVVNVEARNVSRWRDRDDPGEVLSRRLEWSPTGAEWPFVIDLPDFLDEALR